MNAAASPRIALGSVHAPPEVAYPRLLVTRGWPSGIDRRTIDQWEPELAPSAALAGERETLDAATFAARYRAELAARTNLVAWAARMAAGTGVVLLGEVPADIERHLAVLAAAIREQAHRLP